MAVISLESCSAACRRPPSTYLAVADSVSPCADAHRAHSGGGLRGQLSARNLQACAFASQQNLREAGAKSAR